MRIILVVGTLVSLFMVLYILSAGSGTFLDVVVKAMVYALIGIVFSGLGLCLNPKPPEESL